MNRIALIGAVLLISGLILSAILGPPDFSRGIFSSALVVLPILSGIAILLTAVVMFASANGQLDNVYRVYRSITSFFSSGVFYIMLGCLFLLAAYGALDNVHSAFVFLLAILGVAIVLYGTGTQAAGTGNTGTLNVAIAGGAGVLAAVFGFGIINYEKGIQDVFKRSVDYGFLELTTSNSSTRNLNFDELAVTASLDGRPLHLWKQFDKLQIMVPRYSQRGQITITVAIKGPNLPINTPSGLLATPYAVDWESVTPEQSFSNEKIYIQRLSFKLPTTNQSTQFDEKGNSVQSIPLPAN